MRRQFLLPYLEWRRLSRRAYAAQQKDQSEICGLFAVEPSGRIHLFFGRNESNAPSHFELGWDQFNWIRKQIRAAGFRYVGVFHSHPISEAAPGPGDIRRAQPNSLHLIHDVCAVQSRLWKIVRSGRQKRAVAVPLKID